MAKVHSAKVRDSAGDTALNIITGAILVLVILIVGYPCIYVISCSISDPAALQAGRVILWPVNPCIDAYEFVLAYKDVWIGFRNSILYTIGEVFVQMTMIIFTAYPLSRRYYQGRSFIAFFFYMSTKFSAGIIPLFILKANVLGLYDNIWAIIFSGSVGVSGSVGSVGSAGGSGWISAFFTRMFQRILPWPSAANRRISPTPAPSVWVQLPSVKVKIGAPFRV